MMIRTMKRAAMLLLLCAALAVQAQEAQLTRDGDGRLTASRHGVYDSRDRLAVEIEYAYDDDGVVASRTLRQFDRRGRITREETYTADEYLIFVQEHKYDRRGRRVRTLQTSYDDNGEKTVSRFDYRHTADGKVETLLNGISISSAID